MCVLYNLTFRWYLITRKPTQPSVVIVIILGDEDIVLLQQRSKVLADQSPHIQEGHHYQSNPDKAEGGLLPPVPHTPDHRDNHVSSCRVRGWQSWYLHTPHRPLKAALTFLGLGRTAPDEVHTADRLGVTVPPGPVQGLSRAVRTLPRADSLARRPRADAMFTGFDAATMRKTADIFGREALTAPPTAACSNPQLSLF